MQRRGFFKALAALPVLAKAKSAPVEPPKPEARITLRYGLRTVHVNLTEDSSFHVPIGQSSGYRIGDVHSTVPARIFLHSRPNYYDDGLGSYESTALIYDSRYGIIPMQTPIREGDTLYLSAIS